MRRQGGEVTGVENLLDLPSLIARHPSRGCCVKALGCPWEETGASSAPEEVDLVSWWAGLTGSLWKSEEKHSAP